MDVAVCYLEKRDNKAFSGDINMTLEPLTDTNTVEMMDLATTGQMEQDEDQSREEAEDSSSVNPCLMETDSDLEDSKPQNAQDPGEDSGALLQVKEEDQMEDKVPTELLIVNSTSLASSTEKFIISPNTANWMTLPGLVLKLEEVKDEPPEEEKDNILTPSASTTSIKSEPDDVVKDEEKDNILTPSASTTSVKSELDDMVKDEEKDNILTPLSSATSVKSEPDDMEINSVSSLGLNSGTVSSLPTDGSTNIAGATQEPPAQSFTGCLTCSQCRAVLKKGQKIYQLVNSKEFFCSTSCLSAMYPSVLAPPAPTTTKKNCLYCLKVIDQAHGFVPASEDDANTPRDFCGQSCVSAFDSKSKAVHSILSTGTQLQSGVTQTVCSICNKPCTIKFEAILDDVAYKMCSDACFENFKERTKAATQCAMCSTTRPLSDMLCSKDNEGNMELFCTSTCENASRVQTIDASAPPALVLILPPPTSTEPIPATVSVVLATNSATDQPCSSASSAPQVSTVALPNVQETILVQVMPTSSQPMEYQDVNSVNSLKTYPFLRRTLIEQMKIKELGPCQPDLIIKQKVSSRGRSSVRSFSRTYYGKHRWLAGCEQSNAFFCFPCMLFPSFDTQVLWTKSGVSDLKHLSEMCTRHENTHSHLDSSIKLGFFGRQSITQQQKEDHKVGIRKHNEEVTKNRHILSKIIDCIKFCGSFELVSHGHDEKNTSDDRVFHGLVDFVASLDGPLKERLERDTVFTSEMVQNELLECMLSVVRDHIIKEVQSNDFLSIQADEMSRVDTESQLVLVLRYVDDNGNLQERFFECITQESANVESIAAAIKERLAAILPEDQRNKLICQAYDGFSASSTATTSVQQTIQDLYPNAHYIHCYAHRLDRIMQQATSSIPQVRSFFSDLDALASFFSSSPMRTSILDKVVAQRQQTSNNVGLDFHNRAIHTVFEHAEDLHRCLENIRYSADFDSNTIREAGIFISVLETEDFRFFLQLFHAIMPHVDLLDDSLQKKNIKLIHINESIQQFRKSITTIRKNYIHTTIEDRGDSQPRKKQRTLQGKEKIASEVCDIILKHTKERFAFAYHLDSATLLQRDLFKKHDESFPDGAVTDTLKAFPMLLESKLRKELDLIYSKVEFRACRGALDLYQLFMENDLGHVFSETVTLLKILLTIPMTTKEANRCFSTLNRVKTFLRDTVAQERLNALIMLSVEKKLVAEIPDFNQKVIEKFAAQKERSATFMFR